MLWQSQLSTALPTAASVNTPASCEAGVDKVAAGSVRLLADLDQAQLAETVDPFHVVAARHHVDVADAIAGAVEAVTVAPAVMAPAATLEAKRRSGRRSERGSAERGDSGEREHGFAYHDVLLWVPGFP